MSLLLRGLDAVQVMHIYVAGLGGYFRDSRSDLLSSDGTMKEVSPENLHNKVPY